MIILRVGVGEGKSALIHCWRECNWYSLSGRHFGNMYEKSLRRHITFDPVIPCIKIYPKEKMDLLHTHAHIKHI